MSYKYIRVPKTISSKECSENGFVFAPSKYTRFIPLEGVSFTPLSKVCSESKAKIAYTKSNKYQYSEIGDIDILTNTVNSTALFGIQLPSENPKAVQKADILISTVRSYRGGFGLIDSDAENLCCSPAILVIRNVSKKITKEYLLAILRTDFTIEQILGFQTRGMYPRLDSDAMDKLLIPVPDDEKVIKYVSVLMRAYLNKNELIKKRHAEIYRQISNELHDNQNEGTFTYHFPKLKDLQEVGRLDTGVYSKNLKENLNLIQNYKNGSFTIKESDISSGSTPDVRYIGNEPDLHHRWLTPTLCSDYGTITEERINLQGKNNLNEDALLIINRTSKGGIGEYVGISCFYNFQDFGTGQHNQGMYRITKYSTTKKIFILCCLNSKIYRQICANLSVGSKMKELKTKHIASIPFPNFPATKQKEIAELYYNPKEYTTSNCTLDDFLTYDNLYNETAGIYELDKTAKHLRELLDTAIDKIVRNQKVDIVF